MSDDTDVGDVDGIEEETAERLRDDGYETLGDLRDAERSDLFDVEGIGASDASAILSAVEGATDDAEREAGSGSAGDASAANGDDSDGSSADEASESSDSAASEDESSTDEADESSGTEPEAESGDAVASLVDVRNAAQATATELVGHDLDGVIQVTADEDGWLAVVEVVERHAVPDTQDILGRYELQFDEAGRVTGYRRVGRYRRSDGDVDEV